MKTSPTTHKQATSVGLDNLLDADQVADYLGVPTGTLANWRYRGEGPPFVHVGRLVRYRVGDLAAWIEAHLHISSRWCRDSHLG